MLSLSRCHYVAVVVAAVVVAAVVAAAVAIID